MRVPTLTVKWLEALTPWTGRRMMLGMLAGWLVMLQASGNASEQNAQDPDYPAFVELQAITAEVDAIRELLAFLEVAPAWDRDAFRFRIDERLLGLIDRVNLLATSLTDDDMTFDVRTRYRERLAAQVDWALQTALARVADLEDRFAAVQEEIDEFEETTRGRIAESFAQEQKQLMFAYAGALVAHVSAREQLERDSELAAKLSLPSAEIRRNIEITVRRFAERLTGQIRLDAMTLSELRNRRAEDPLNVELERATQTVRRKQSRNLGNLETVIELATRLDIDAARYRTLLVQQRGVVGVELLERQVLYSVMAEQWERLQRSVVRNGPNFAFRTLVFVLIFAITLLLAGVVRRTVYSLTHLRAVHINRLAAAALVSVSWIVVVVFGLVLALSTLGVSIGPMLAGFGVAGIILGFALQDSLSNLASGAMILLYRPYDVDDHIRISGAEGVVRRMNLVATTVHTFDNQVLVVPNNKIWGDTITNFTASRVRRVDVEASFGYDEDMDRVEHVLMAVLEDNELVLSSPEPRVHMGQMGDSAVTMMVKGWVQTENYWPALWSLTREIKRRFDVEGIRIPFPQRDVHLHGRDEAAPR